MVSPAIIAASRSGSPMKSSRANSPVKPSVYPAWSAPGPSSVSPHPADNEDNTIWSYVRDLRGVVGILYRSVPPSPPSESLGERADRYLLAHGYTHPAITTITLAAHSSSSHTEFAEALAVQGVPWTEAEWLWDIIDH